MTDTLYNSNAVAIDWPVHRRLMMVLIGYIPFLLSVVVAACAIVVARRWGLVKGLGYGVVVFYVFPPLALRMASLLFKPEPGRHSVASAAFLRWWLSAQWQVIFNRLPMLEELLRLVPGLYSAWLRLWGAKIGSLVYWSPGVAVLDRPFVRIGNRVVFGAGVRLNPHVIVPGKKREAQLWLAPVTLGDDALIGGYSLITAGCTVPPGVSLPAGKYVRPFSTWQDNEPAQSRNEGDSD
ncbi:MAG: hypothetical protein ABR881_21575 [Candidatus Sulfotelmatobacter sp.]|jgi:hypothetical protein